MLQGTLQFRQGQGSGQLLYEDKQISLLGIILVKIRYLNTVDLNLLTSIKQSILDYFTG